MGNVDPRVIFALQRDSDALGLLVWKAAEGQIGLAIMRDGEQLAALPIALENAVELAVELAGFDLAALERYAASLPPAIAINIAAALLMPHRDSIVGAAAIVKHAKALERGKGCAESA